MHAEPIDFRAGDMEAPNYNRTIALRQTARRAEKVRPLRPVPGPRPGDPIGRIDRRCAARRPNFILTRPTKRCTLTGTQGNGKTIDPRRDPRLDGKTPSAEDGMRHQLRTIVALVFVIIAVLPAKAPAQATTGTISGAVTDESKAV